MTRAPRRLGRLGLLLWLLMPFLVVALLWLSIDRSRGRADPDRWRHVPAGPGIPSSSAPAPAPESPQP